MPRTIRKYWGPIHGRATLNYNWDAIGADSVVVVTASECTGAGVRFIGAATISADNIAPHGPPYDSNRGVTFTVNVGWDSPLAVVTDITVLDRPPVEVQRYTPTVGNRIGMRMQYQQSSLWCWIAVAVSIDHYYDPSSSWTQCQVMTEIGHEINEYPADTGACPSATALARNPGLAARYGAPYSSAALFVLDDPLLGIDRRYLKSGGVSDSLKKVGNYVDWRSSSTTLAEITAEIRAGRPVVAGITWRTGGSHYVVIAGIDGEGMLILDPVSGEGFTEFGEFPGTYRDGATLDGYAFTKP